LNLRRSQELVGAEFAEIVEAPASRRIRKFGLKPARDGTALENQETGAAMAPPAGKNLIVTIGQSTGEKV
jgi:hypothetical protein